MNTDISEVQTWAVTLIETLKPALRKRLLRKMAITMASQNRQRMGAQKDAQGKPWAPRAHKKKRAPKMMAKLAQAKHLRATATANNAKAGFTRAISRVAEIHHHGLIDRVTRKGPAIKYPARPLLGLNDQDEHALDEHILQHFARALHV